MRVLLTHVVIGHTYYLRIKRAAEQRGWLSSQPCLTWSPVLAMQGAFILIGQGATGIYILIVMAVALCTYICWRFWEGITAQVLFFSFG